MTKIILHTCDNAEDNAMLQALYSRSAESVTTHLEKIKETGSGKFMSQYYLGYGHASIGDCGGDTLYFEGISMLAAKAIEDNPLFVGQECSSRYIDFSTADFYNNGRTLAELKAIEDLYARYRAFYTSSMEPLKIALRERFPIQEGDKEAVYEKAIAARAFDILRGFLPTGATTNVAWTFRFSNAGEHLTWMMHHPLKEVKELAVEAYRMLWTKYPNSFRFDHAGFIDSINVDGALPEIEGAEKYAFESEMDNFYTQIWVPEKGRKLCRTEDLLIEVELDDETPSLAKLSSGFVNRTKRSKLHKHSLFSKQDVYVSATLDFGSFRDIQRHRNGYCSMPMVTDEFGVHPWYYDNLTEDLRKEAYILLNAIEATYALLVPDGTDVNARAQAQYILPMGNVVPVVLKYDIRQSVYVAELRSSKTVHATLRPVAQEMARVLGDFGIPMYYDRDEDNWTVRRGEQDIIKKS
jgi:thymidylate synthase ThyX